jgi:hypothetical protein
MYKSVEITSNLEYLCKILPQFREDFELYEVLAYDLDGTLYMPVTTPDVKLYYPEPYIASPSFMHEEISFLHVLHYQY